MAFLKEPKIPKPIELILRIAEKKLGNRMMPARLLLWAPKAFVSSMILEGLVAHKAGRVDPRMLKLIRMQVSLRIACPFCIDMNSSEFRQFGITKEEIRAMQGVVKISEVKSLDNREKMVLYYAQSLVRTPIRIDKGLVNKMKQGFSEKEFATIVTTIAQVDYWTRVIQGFGIRPVGFLETCDIEMINRIGDQ